MKVSIKNNVKEFNKEFKKFQRVDIPNVTRIALNETATRIKELEQASMRKSFDRPRPQTIKSVYVQFAKKNKLEAHITFREWAQEFIHRNIVGGVRSIINTAVPTVNARLNQYGNIPGRKSGVVKGKQFKATINGIYGVWERNKNGLKIIHRFETNPKYKPIFPFYKVANKAAKKLYPIKYEKVANYYIKKAGYKAK
jgi:hypothetical protein